MTNPTDRTANGTLLGAFVEAAAERDALRAQRAAALAVLDQPRDPFDDSGEKLTRVRAALQPTEPAKRCCIGPFADGTHAVNCWQRCQDCGGDEAGPRRCRCRPDLPAAPLCGCRAGAHEGTCPDFRAQPTGEAVADPTDELRAAAKLLCERAAAATAGPWRNHDGWVPGGGFVASVLSGEGADTDLRAWLPTFSNDTGLTKRNVWNDARWIALMSPVLAEPLAAWLENTADWGASGEPCPYVEAEAVARAILGGAA